MFLDLILIAYVQRKPNNLCENIQLHQSNIQVLFSLIFYMFYFYMFVCLFLSTSAT